jgi:hypothetical protein
MTRVRTIRFKAKGIRSRFKVSAGFRDILSEAKKQEDEIRRRAKIELNEKMRELDKYFKRVRVRGWLDNE